MQSSVVLPRSTRSTSGVRAAQVGAHLGLLVAVLVAIIPFLWAILDSLKVNDAIFLQPFSLPSPPLWSNYAEAWGRGHFGVYVWNSAAIAVPSVALSLLCSSLAGFAFARLRFPASRAVTSAAAALDMVISWTTYQ